VLQGFLCRIEHTEALTRGVNVGKWQGIYAVLGLAAGASAVVGICIFLHFRPLVTHFGGRTLLFRHSGCYGIAVFILFHSFVLKFQIFGQFCAFSRYFARIIILCFSPFFDIWLDYFFLLYYNINKKCRGVYYGRDF
jgi:hypothetical protein